MFTRYWIAVFKMGSFPFLKSSILGDTFMSGSTPLPINSTPSGKVDLVVTTLPLPPPGNEKKRGVPLDPEVGSPIILPLFMILKPMQKFSAIEAVLDRVSITTGFE